MRDFRLMRGFWFTVLCLLLLGAATLPGLAEPTTLPAPNLLAPAHQSTGVVLEPLLKWNSVNSATSYIVQYARNAAFTEGLVTRDNVTSTQLQLQGLALNTSYAWRVRARNATQTSGWSAIWYFTTGAEETILPAPTLIAPAHQSTVYVPNPQLKWNAVSGATSYIVQYARNAAFTEGLVTRENVTATQLLVEGLSLNASYAWRVRARNTTQTSAWSTIWYFNTRTPEPDLPAPVLVAPAHQSTVTVPNPLLKWNAVSKATSYIVQYARNSAFTEGLVTRENVTATQLQVDGLTINTSYAWRVRARNAMQTSAWSTIWYFNTRAPEPDLPVPILVAPAHQSTVTVPNPLLKWNAVSKATSYIVQYARNSAFTEGLVTRENVTATQLQVEGLIQNASYAWRVRARNATQTSAWSAIWYFNMRVPEVTLPAPTLVAPALQSTGIVLNPLFKWNAVNGATSYIVQYARNTAFTEGLVTRENVTATQLQVEGLTPNTIYLWRVKARNATQTSAWSTIWYFTTRAAENNLPAPTLLSPAHQSTGIVLNPLLKWNAVNGATSYIVQYARNTAFTEGLVTRENVTATQLQVEGLTPNTIYLWRVKARNATQTSAWSTIWYFTTRAAENNLPAPTLLSPAHQSTGIVLNPLLKWNAVNGATSYIVQYARNTAFTEGLVTRENVTATQLQVEGLSPNTIYLWRVKARNATQTSAWSTIWYFTTRTSNVTLPAPTLIAPSNESTGISVDPLLKWNSIGGATLYLVQYARNATFTEGLVTRDTTATQLQLDAIAANAVFFWRVLARNASEFSEWSITWRFTTGNPESTLPAPILISPGYQSTGVDVNPLLKWQSVSGATSYVVQYARNAAFTEGLVTRENLTSTQLQIQGLAANTSYVWRVRARNATTASAWSTVWYFTTRPVNVDLPAPMLHEPANQTTGLSLNPRLAWNAVAGATSYIVQFARNDGFTEGLVTRDNVTETQVQLEGLTAGTKYFWRVRARNATVTSAWSVVWFFVTKSGETIGVSYLRD